MVINSEDINSIKPFLKKFHLPKTNSHKGQNGRVLIIGGSKLFHAASIWAAEIASCFVDIVHYSSIEENNQVFLTLKKKFRNGIIVSQQELPDYVKEDDSILVGPGMVRAEKPISNIKYQISNINSIFNIKNEADYTFFLTKYLIENFPEKKFVFDAGSLQTMDKNWLLKLKTQPIITPHQRELEWLFGRPLYQTSIERKKEIVEETAKKFNCVILLKTVVDIISDGNNTLIVEGGNAGLTKGGTGDLLAGLVLAFYAKNDSITSSVMASYLLKKAADELFLKKGYWYNISDLIENIPQVMRKIFFHL